MNGLKEIETVNMISEINAIKALNKRISALNEMKDFSLPHYPEIRGHQPIIYNSILERIEVEEQVEQIEQIEQIEQVKPKPTKPKRKPFTPYGLNGYFVDKSGNIRLHLDRKANAKTITIEADFFNALAEMVKRTQEASNAELV